MEQLSIVSLIAAFVIPFVIYYLIKKGAKKDIISTSPSLETQENKPTKLAKPQAKKKAQKQKASKSNPTHPFYLNGFKGFSSEITDFDIKNNYFAACCSVI